MRKEVKILSHELVDGSEFESYWKDPMQLIEIEGGHPKKIIADNKSNTGIDLSKKIGQTVILEFPTVERSHNYVIVNYIEDSSNTESGKQNVNELRFFKLQIKDDTNNINYVDEVINDNRITSNPEYAKKAYIKLIKGDIVLIHKGNTAHSLVRVIKKLDSSKIKDQNKKSFGVDYKIEVLSFFKKSKEFDYKEIGINKLGFSNTFSPIKDKTVPTYKFIYSWLKSLNQNKRMTKELSLLKHKKQIILQGPPGTGKTRLAKKIAEELTKEIKRYNTKDKIVDFFKEFSPSKEKIEQRKSLESLIVKFNEKFKATELKDITLEQYALGSEEMDNFCYWLEYKLTKNGKYTGHATKGKIYWDSTNEEYKKSGFIKDVESDEEAMEKVAALLDDIINERNVPYPIGKGFVLKVLNTYYPKKYFPINNEKCINNFLKLIGKEDSKLGYIEKNKLAQEYFLELKKQHNTDTTNNEFMEFLFDQFDLKGTIELEGNELIEKGEFKTIQFHPSYTYEDFVRGITVQSNNKNQIVYNTKNRVLAQFAEKALKNKNANYVLIIDEINRANLSSVLGELIYALEYRGEAVESMYDLNNSEEEDKTDKEIILPKNLYIIGTMNTADRSVGQIDYAIRRRFAFVDVLPQVLENAGLNIERKEEKKLKFAKDSFIKISNLFIKNEIKTYKKGDKLIRSEHLSEEFNPKDVWLGHSYFILEEDGDFSLNLSYEIKPILEEYVNDGILKDSALVEIEKLGK